VDTTIIVSRQAQRLGRTGGRAAKHYHALLTDVGRIAAEHDASVKVRYPDGWMMNVEGRVSSVEI